MSHDQGGRFVLTDYIDAAMAQAVYDQLEDGTFVAEIPPCEGVIAFAATQQECETELRSVVEDWVLLGLKLGDIQRGDEVRRGPVP